MGNEPPVMTSREELKIEPESKSRKKYFLGVREELRKFGQKKRARAAHH